MASTSSTASAHPYYVMFRITDKAMWEEDNRFPTKDEAEAYVAGLIKPMDDIDPETGKKRRGKKGEQQVKGVFRVWDTDLYNKYFGISPESIIKEVNMDKKDLYVYETHIGIGKGASPVWSLVVTNAPNDREQKLYDRMVELRESHNPIKAEDMLMKETQQKFRVKGMGETFTIPFLVEYAAKRFGCQFRLEMVKLKEKDPDSNLVEDLLDEQQIEALKLRAANSTMSWSGSTSTNIMHISRDKKLVSWERLADDLGLIIGNSRKMAKRLNELSRTSELWVIDDFSNLTIEFVEDHALGDMAVDGQVVVSPRFVRKHIANINSADRRRQMYRSLSRGHMASWNIRVLTPMGLVKGDAIIGDKDQVSDIIMHSCNMKAELGMKGNFLSTLNPHHPHHVPTISTQALSWGMDFFVTEERLMQDYTAMTTEFKDAMVKGEYPSHLLNTAPLHTDEFELNESGYLGALRNSTTRFLATGLTLSHSSHLMAQLSNGYLRKLSNDISDCRLPNPWSVLAHSTCVAMLEMAGYDLSGYDKSKMFWHAPTGRMCWSTEDFVNMYARHGGHDLDDSHTTMLRIKEVDANDNPSMTFTINSKVWCIKAVNLRSPNGLSYFGKDKLPGEYSMLDIDLKVEIVQCGFIALPVFNFPLYNVYGPIPTIKSKMAPKYTHHQDVESEELPMDDYEFGPSFSPEDAVRQIALAMVNPGIGSIISPLIALTSIFGTYPELMPAPLEGMVDAAEQTPDFEAFKVMIQTKKSWNNAMMFQTNNKVDRFIAHTRLSSKVRRHLITQDRIEEGVFSRITDHMKSTVEDLRVFLVGDTSRRVVLKGLDITNRKVIEELMNVEVPKEAKAYSFKIFKKFGAEKQGFPKFEMVMERSTRRFLPKRTPWVAYARRLCFIKLNNDLLGMMDHLTVAQRFNVMVGLYQIIIENGHKDDVLFQTGDQGLDGVMDVFISTLFHHGVIKSMVVDGHVLYNS